MSGTALVVGGTGPTGVPIVQGLLDLGLDVTVMHSGRHRAPPFSRHVEVIHVDTRERADLVAHMGKREWDTAVCTSGRLLLLLDLLSGRVGRLVGVTGQPVYASTMRATPEGQVPLPIPESADRQSDAQGYFGKISIGEDDLFARHAHGDFEGVVVRYPGIYGERAYLAHEWAVVRRILDARPAMILPHDGCTYFQRGHALNVARLVVLAAISALAPGHAFNAGDERVLSARGVAEIIRNELDSTIDLVGIPAAFCPQVYPLAEKSSLILDLSSAKSLLGYRDVVDVEGATRGVARYLAENPIARADENEAIMGRFDYPLEDDLIKRWRRVEEAWSAADQTNP